MVDIYSLADYGLLAFLSIGLLLSWNIATARWFLISYAVVIVINLASYPVSSEWKTHYYLFQACVNVAFMLPVVYRRDLAMYIYKKTKVDFYRQVYEKQQLSAQECMIAIAFSFAILVNLTTWCELLAYKAYWIDSYYFKLYLRDNIILVIQLILSACLLTYAIKAESRELNN